MPNFRAIKFLSLINGYNKKGIEVLIYTPGHLADYSDLNIKTVTKQVWFYFIRGTTCTRPGCAETITNLQIVLILYTPQNPCLLIKLPKKYLPKFSYPKKSRNRKFKPKKILRPSALSLEIRSTPPPHREGAEVCISFRELHITVLEPKTGYFAIVVCSLRIPIEWLN